MAYHLYQAEGFILASRRRGEANKLYEILTPELGLIQVAAQGVRHLHSKLRYHLADLSYVRIAVVHGKEFWRLTGAEEIGQFQAIYSDRDKLLLVARIFSLIRRLVAGEGEARDLCLVVTKALVALETLSNGEAGRAERSAWELMTLLRLLSILGYLKEDASLAPYIATNEWSPLLLEKMKQDAPRARELINLSLLHSHL